MGNAAVCSACPICDHSAALSSPPQAINILLVGLDGAGKTTIVHGLSKESVEPPPPTLGFRRTQLPSSISSVTRPVCVFEVGGARDIRDIWRNYVADCHALVFAVDAAAGTGRCVEAQLCLHALLHRQHQLHGKPLLVLANKQDVPSALDEVEISDALQLERLANTYRCPTRIEACTARLPQGSGSSVDPPLELGFRWLVEFVDSHFESLNVRVLGDLEDQRVELLLQAESRRARIAARAAQEELAAGCESEGGVNEDIPLEKASTPLVTVEAPSPVSKLTAVSSFSTVTAPDGSAATGSSRNSVAVYMSPRHQPNSSSQAAVVQAEIHHTSVGVSVESPGDSPEVHHRSNEGESTFGSPEVHHTSREVKASSGSPEVHDTPLAIVDATCFPEVLNTSRASGSSPRLSTENDVNILCQSPITDEPSTNNSTLLDNEVSDKVIYPSQTNALNQSLLQDQTSPSQVMEESITDSFPQTRSNSVSEQASEQATAQSHIDNPSFVASSSASSIFVQPALINSSSSSVISVVSSRVGHSASSLASFTFHPLPGIVNVTSSALTHVTPSPINVTSTSANVTSSLLTYVTSPSINITSSPAVITSSLSSSTTTSLLDTRNSVFSSIGSLPLPPVDEVPSQAAIELTSLHVSESSGQIITSPIHSAALTSVTSSGSFPISSEDTVSITSHIDSAIKFLPPGAVISAMLPTNSTPTPHEIPTVESLQKTTEQIFEPGLVQSRTDNHHCYVDSSRMTSGKLAAISESVAEARADVDSSLHSHDQRDSPEATAVWDSGRASGEETDSDISVPHSKAAVGAISRHSRFFRRFSSSVAPIQ